VLLVSRLSSPLLWRSSSRRTPSTPSTAPETAYGYYGYYYSDYKPSPAPGRPQSLTEVPLLLISPCSCSLAARPHGTPPLRPPHAREWGRRPATRSSTAAIPDTPSRTTLPPIPRRQIFPPPGTPRHRPPKKVYPDCALQELQHALELDPNEVYFLNRRLRQCGSSPTCGASHDLSKALD